MSQIRKQLNWYSGERDIMKRKSFVYRFLVIALILCMFSGLASTALAEEADYISYGEDCTTFAKDADISTIYIDQDKINSDEAETVQRAKS